jgi:serine/threonine-protein kinase
MAGTDLERLGPYRLRRLLGTGGMAEIHLSEQSGIADFQRPVAIKVLHAHLQDNPAVVELFIREAQITATLDHPNIVQVYGLERDQDRMFMVMEHVDGIDLRRALDRLLAVGQTLSADLALLIAIEVAKALRHAHASLPSRAAHHQPIIHRDLSPGNVMLTAHGAVKLLDFGVAKTLLGDEQTDRIARGKWPYMSPEQVRGETLDARSDLFSLGALLYELLSGTPAFRGRTVVDSMRRVERADVPPAPGVEPVVEQIMARLLARDRGDRYADASEAIEAMIQVLILRGQTSGEREIAALVSGALRPGAQAADEPPPAAATLAAADGDAADEDGAPGKTTPGDAIDEDATLPPQGSEAFGVGELTGQLTIPAHRPRDATVDAASARARARDPVPEALGPHDETLPPLASPRHQRRGEAPGAAARDEEDELETTAARAGPADAEVAPPPAPFSAAGHANEPERVTGVETFAEGAGSSPRGATPRPAEPAEPPPGGAPSEPRIYFDHFMPADSLVQPETPAPRMWTPRNLVVLGLAVLAILIAGLAILLAVKQQLSREGARYARGGPAEGLSARPDGGPLRNDGAAGRQDGAAWGPPPERRALAPGPDAGRRADASDRSEAGVNTPSARRARDRPAGPPRRREGTRPRARPAGRKPAGLPKRGQLDVITRPPGARVFVDGERRGQSPLRVPVTPGGRVRLSVSLPGYKLYKSPVWIPRGMGRRISLILPRVAPRLRRAAPRRTALRVQCRTEGRNRVYVDGKDTGYDCPTPALAVSPTVHTVSLYVPASHRVVWKRIRPAPGKVTVVRWEH